MKYLEMEVLSHSVSEKFKMALRCPIIDEITILYVVHGDSGMQVVLLDVVHGDSGMQVVLLYFVHGDSGM